MEVGFNRALASDHNDIEACAVAGQVQLSGRFTKPASNPVALHRASEPRTDRIPESARLRLAWFGRFIYFDSRARAQRQRTP